MTTVDFEHRNDIVSVDNSTYLKFVDNIVETTYETPGIASIVLCGSLSKGTCVSGWSDIDIIFFFNEIESPTSAFKDIGNAIKRLQSDIQIPVGVDIVSSDRFLQTHRIGGRPLAMTYEVAGCGKTLYGDDFFTSISWDESQRKSVLVETPVLIAAELHNWRRWFITFDMDSDPISALRRNVKTCLKLIKYATDPNLTGPFSYEQCIDYLAQTSNTERDIAIFSMAVKTRAYWETEIKSLKNVSLKNKIFSEMLANKI